MNTPWPRRMIAGLATMVSLASVACDGPQSNGLTLTPGKSAFSAGPKGGGSGGGGGSTVAPPNPCTLGYPYASSNSRTILAFNENEVLRTFTPAIAYQSDQIRVWYSDEHAMTLGVRQVFTPAVKATAATRNTPATKASAASTVNYAVSLLTSNPSVVDGPDIGTTGTYGVDGYGRPIAPVMYITDVTTDPASRAGDWQFGGSPIAPHAIFGTWKAAVVDIDPTGKKAPTITPDADPSKNGWNLGSGSDVPPGGFATLKNEGYGTEIRWNVSQLLYGGKPLQKNHTYRMQFMVHDGDQNQTGGDVGESCMTVAIR